MNTLIIKLAIIISVLAINILLIPLISLYDEYLWYLIFVSLGSVFRIIVILIILSCVTYMLVSKYCCRKKSYPISRGKAVGLVVPCYTEGRELISTTLKSCSSSLQLAEFEYNIKPFFIIVCDGIQTGANNTESTRDILLDLLEPTPLVTERYVSWKGIETDVDIGFGCYEDIPYVLFLKQQNRGKKDSLIMVRDFINPEKNDSINNHYATLKKSINDQNVEYLVGTDAGTRFGQQTVSLLYKTIERDPDVLGVSGFVKADHTVSNWYNWLFFFQCFEYVGIQGMTRLGQSYIGKVTCLPGCVQIFRTDERTLGNTLNEFKKLPKESLREKIIAYLGEDRRYTCLTLYNNQDCKTKLCVDAVVYTDVPSTWAVFLSQRRRWFLSANANNIEDVKSNKLPFLIRALAFIQLWNTAFMLINVVCVIRIFYLTYYKTSEESVIAFVLYMAVSCYKVILTIKFTRDWKWFIYFIFSLIGFTVISPAVNFIVTMYSLWTMDDFTWGHTQRVKTVEQNEEKPEELSITIHTDVDYGSTRSIVREMRPNIVSVTPESTELDQTESNTSSDGSTSGSSSVSISGSSSSFDSTSSSTSSELSASSTSTFIENDTESESNSGTTSESEDVLERPISNLVEEV